MPDLGATNAIERGEPVDVHVQVERTVRVENDSLEAGIDMFRSHDRPTTTWTSQGTWSTTGDMRDMRNMWDPQESWMMTTRR